MGKNVMLTDSQPYPVKLNVGCGYDIREGYLNVDNGDWHNPDLISDITDLKELPDQYFSEIVAQDVLEHIDREKQVHTVQRWARLLTPDGRLKVRVPSLTDMVALAFHPEWQNTERQNYLIQMVYGTQAYPGDYHRCGYTPQTVTDLAAASGLVVSNVELRDSWLYDLTFRPARASLSPSEIVHNVYFTHIHRIPDPNGVEYWSSRIGQDLSADDVVREIITAAMHAT
ncbi:methyltransferase domain-containing protein [Methylobacterium sp. WL6]|uniref:class I SAM-dependent methyltransferase n=1 Tax=Methylobacterium sp. WL6 TaxID=2603901 RepID=UPI0011C7C50A|nr:methyltransferase domain-containing protein [Methylobacterium sp. WL6]TXN60960.1 methyltransferase domain-containing protein [Methylobacterium sp. WL6]